MIEVSKGFLTPETSGAHLVVGVAVDGVLCCASLLRDSSTLSTARVERQDSLALRPVTFCLQSMMWSLTYNALPGEDHKQHEGPGMLYICQI